MRLASLKWRNSVKTSANPYEPSRFGKMGKESRRGWQWHIPELGDFFGGVNILSAAVKEFELEPIRLRDPSVVIFLRQYIHSQCILCR